MRLSSKNLWPKQVWILKIFFTGFTNELELSQSSIWLTMGSDEFSMTSVKSGLTIEGLNHIITIPRGSFFYFTRLPLHTTRGHWSIIRLIGCHLDDRWSSKDRIRNIPIHRKKFRWYYDRDHNISLSDRMEPIGSHIKRFNLKFANWTYEVLIGLGFIEILLSL